MNFSNAEFERAYGRFEELPESDLPEIVFCGRSNVGKSSLINKIFNRKSLARTSSVPGKTVTINFYRAGEARLVDLPGYGYARLPKTEKQRFAGLMEGYFRSERKIRLAVVLVDMRRAPTDDDMMMMDFLAGINCPFAVVMTKSDKLNKREYAERLASAKTELAGVNAVDIIPFSAVKGENVEKIKKIINIYSEV